MNARPVLRVANPSPTQFFDEFVRTQTPVVLTGTGEATYLDDAFAPSSVAAATQGTRFHFKHSSSGAHPNFRADTVPEMFAREALTFAEFFARIQQPDSARYIFTGDEHYLWRVRDGAKSTSADFGTLADVVSIPRYVPHERVYSVWAWFSGKGVRTWLHYDNNGCHNLNLQVHGAKRCTLFSPEVCNDLAFLSQVARFRPSIAAA